MHHLGSAGLVSAATDNSDGLFPTLQLLAEANELTAELDLDQLTVPDLEKEPLVEPERLWLGWGDWNVVATVPPRNLDLAQQIAKRHSSRVIPIGTMRRGEKQVVLRRKGIVKLAPRLESERFSKDSWFSQGVESYISHFLGIQLI